MDTNIRLLRFMSENDFDSKIAVVAHTDDEEKVLRDNRAAHVLRPFQDAAETEIEKIS